MKYIDRRTFLRISGASALTLALAACDGGHGDYTGYAYYLGTSTAGAVYQRHCSEISAGYARHEPAASGSLYGLAPQHCMVFAGTRCRCPLLCGESRLR